LTSSRKRSGVPNGCFLRLVFANGLLAFLKDRRRASQTHHIRGI